MFGITQWIRCFSYGETRWLFCTYRKQKPSHSEILSNADSFLKISFFFRCFSHIFAIVNQLPGFSISRLVNVEDLYICIYIYIYIYISLFLLPHFFCNVEFKCSWFNNTEQSSEILSLEIEMLLEFQNKTNIEIIGF